MLGVSGRVAMAMPKAIRPSTPNTIEAIKSFWFFMDGSCSNYTTWKRFLGLPASIYSSASDSTTISTNRWR